MHFFVFASSKVEASIDKGDSQLTYMLVKPLHAMYLLLVDYQYYTL